MKRMIRTLVYVGPDRWIDGCVDKRGVKGNMNVGSGMLISEVHEPIITMLAEDTPQDRLETARKAIARLDLPTKGELYDELTKMWEMKS